MVSPRSTRTLSHRTKATALRDQTLAQLLAHVEAGTPLVLVKAPPGSGKTYTLQFAVRLAVHQGKRVAVATQTNAQASDFCLRLGEMFDDFPVVRFASQSHAEEDLGAQVELIRDKEALPSGPCVVVATAAKWANSELPEPFDLLLIDEAWQLLWADFTGLNPVAGRFLLVGDPGQIAPVVTVEVARWQTSAHPPHLAVPDALLREVAQGKRQAFPVLTLPVSTRLPFDTRELVQHFYDFPFSSWAQSGDRFLELNAVRRKNSADLALDNLQRGSLSMLTLPTPEEGPPEDDRELASHAASAVRRLLERKAIAVTEEGRRKLTPEDIGMVATHRVVNARLIEELGPLAGRVRVDTPERWQGLERAVMVAVHPLSSVPCPGEFDLDTGRLCVMTSRHRVGLLLITRDHIATTLDQHVPPASQPLDCPDLSGQGHARHQQLWAHLQERDCVIS